MAISDAEISDELGGLIWEALQAFSIDASYFEDMIQAANRIDHVRQQQAERYEGKRPTTAYPAKRRLAWERADRIVAGIDSGVSAEMLAQQEGITVRGVRTIYGKFSPSGVGLW